MNGGNAGVASTSSMTAEHAVTLMIGTAIGKKCLYGIT